MKIYLRDLLLLIFAGCAFVVSVAGQATREISVNEGQTIEIKNLHGRVEVIGFYAASPLKNACPTCGRPAGEGTGKDDQSASVTALSERSVTDSELIVSRSSGVIRIETKPSARGKRIDLHLHLPHRTSLRITTNDGEARIAGSFSSVRIKTETGTIAADVPVNDLRYEMLWTESRPRFLSDIELEEVKEGSAGKFSISGKYRSSEAKVSVAQTVGEEGNGEARHDERSNTVDIKFTTARGIILLNVPPNEVMNDLRERPLTEAARSIVRSGDSVLIDAVRRASPKHFGEYSRTLPPIRRQPELVSAPTSGTIDENSIKTASVTVLDANNRSVAGLTKEAFEVTEGGELRETISVRPTNAPVNLVLLIDVSGSVENHVNFIRKAARAFIETVNSGDRLSIVIFNDDVKEIATFSRDKGRLSRSLDTFDAGGATAYYDALGYVLTDTLRSLRGERTAIVVLSDGDDNRSFLPFDSLASAIEESGALIYPLYVPSNLIAAAASDPLTAVDPLRSRYLSNDLTSKADGEGKRLAEISGGVYYPITQLSQIQPAYDDIVVQLRTAYDITFRSGIATPDGRPSPRLKVRTNRPNTYVHVRSVYKRKD